MAAPPPDEGLIILHEVVYHVTEVLFAISVIAAAFTIVTFTLFARLRTYPIKLIIYLCCTIVAGHTVFAISPYLTNTVLCTPAAAIVHFFLLVRLPPLPCPGR